MKAAKGLVEKIDIESTVYDFCSLLKPRVMSLVVFTGIAGIYLAPGTIHPLIALVATLCIALGSGAAGAINMWYERDIDAVMARTKDRAIPKGKVLPEHALEFGIIMAVVSVVLMLVATNITAALLLLQAILFYVFVYTVWLKRRTPYNIVIGGAAGAFPPMIGWAAVTGDIQLEGVILFLITFMWTPPHFWALALYKNDDYTKAGIPMLPVVAGSEATRRQILLYTLGLVAVSFLPFVFEMSGWLYTIGASVLGVQFFYHAYGLYQTYSEQKARAMFKFSLLYLFLIFVLLMADKWIIHII
jgi:heme o synthase